MRETVSHSGALSDGHAGCDRTIFCRRSCCSDQRWNEPVGWTHAIDAGFAACMCDLSATAAHSRFCQVLVACRKLVFPVLLSLPAPRSSGGIGLRPNMCCFDRSRWERTATYKLRRSHFPFDGCFDLRSSGQVDAEIRLGKHASCMGWDLKMRMSPKRDGKEQSIYTLRVTLPRIVVHWTFIVTIIEHPARSCLLSTPDPPS